MSAQEIINELPNLPPDDLRRVKATVDELAQAEPQTGMTANDGKMGGLKPPTATPEMVRRRMKALTALRELGGLKSVIPDPVAWQREMREDRSLPGRD